MSTIVVKVKPKPSWHLVDAEGKTLGRLASKIARLLIGKHKPIFSTHVDVGDAVIVVNAGKIRVTGHKDTDKIYYHHSMYPGGIKSQVFRDKQAQRPESIIEIAVKGMLPRNKLRAVRMRKLKVYRGAQHPHKAQLPVALEL